MSVGGVRIHQGQGVPGHASLGGVACCPECGGPGARFRPGSPYSSEGEHHRLAAEVAHRNAPGACPGGAGCVPDMGARPWPSRV